MAEAEAIRQRFLLLRSTLNERARRLWAASEARVIGYGGIAAVRQATGLAYETIAQGLRDLKSADSWDPGRVRRRGAGRKKCTMLDPTLAHDMEALVEPVSRGDPESPLRWTCKSLRRLAVELEAQGHKVSHVVVGELLHEMGYSLQANRKTKEGAQHPDRNAQFEHINTQVVARQEKGAPVISVDTKKKELIGDFKNGGREWRPRGNPEKVRTHDFMIKELGKVSPYGVYDVTRNAGWVSVGIDHDTAAFAVATIARWWRQMGRPAYPGAKSLLITADAGGSNGARIRLWKWELQKFADRSGLTITVCHLPPGTSKWNKIEHRLFSFITQNWRGRPLITHAAVVNLIAATRTNAGLKVRCALDRRRYPKGVKVSDDQMANIRVERDPFHGDWNYTIRPRKP